MAEYRHYAIPDKEWDDFPNNLPAGTRIDPMNRDRLPIQPQEGLEIEESDVTARDEYPIRVRTYRKTGASGLPLFIYIHGGGFVTGGLETDDRYCRKIAAEVDVMVLSIEYRLAPEHKFPTGFEDCFDVVEWVGRPESQEQLQVDLTKGYVLGGTSAGGNFTAGLAHLARDQGITPRLTGLVFLASSFCHPEVRPAHYRDRILSIDEVYDAPGLSRKSIEYFADLAKKALFSVCGWDPRRDEAILLEKLLQAEGVETRIKVHPGLPHGFWTTCPLLPVSLSWEEELVKNIRWILE